MTDMKTYRGYKITSIEEAEQYCCNSYGNEREVATRQIKVYIINGPGMKDYRVSYESQIKFVINRYLAKKHAKYNEVKKRLKEIDKQIGKLEKESYRLSDWIEGLVSKCPYRGRK